MKYKLIYFEDNKRKQKTFKNQESLYRFIYSNNNYITVFEIINL